MGAAAGPAPPPGAVDLLERAVAYTRESLLEVSEADLTRATPCSEWSLADLLEHMDDALVAMAEAAQGSNVALVPDPGPALPELLESICRRACGLLELWHPPRAGQVALGDLSLTRELVGCVGALEITLHGWDVATALGRPRAIPPDLAMDLWPVARDHIVAADRHAAFGPALEVPDWASPQERLLAHSGRRD